MLLILKDYKRKLDEKQWETTEVRDTTKGRWNSGIGKEIRMLSDISKRNLTK